MKGNGLNDKVAYLLIRVDESLVFALPSLQAERDDFELSSILIDSSDRPISVIASAFTGTVPLRHDVHTPFVPDLEGDSDEERPRLRHRSSLDFGEPLLNHRLSGRGIASLSVGLPLVPAARGEASILTEIPLSAVQRKSKEEKVDMLTSVLGFLAGGVAMNPEIRLLMASFNMIAKEQGPEREDSDSEVEGEDPSSEESVSEEKRKMGVESARRLLAFIDAIRETAGVTHVYAAISTGKTGSAILVGPRSDEFNAQFVRITSGAGITLSLLGEAVPADVAGGNLLRQKEASTASWAVDSVDLTPVDWEGAFDRVRQGHASEAEVAMTSNHFKGRLRAAVMMIRREEAIRAATRVQAIEPSASNLLGLAIVQVQGDKLDECRASVQKIQAEHADTLESDLAELIPGLGTEPQRIDEILDRYEYPTGSNFLIRQLWTRSLGQNGRVDRAIDSGWKLISQKIASMQDRVIFARFSMDRLQANDAGRAALVLRMIKPKVPVNKNGEPVSFPLILRAQALHASGQGKKAVMLLKTLLGFYPLEPKASKALNEIQRDLAGSDT